MNFLLEKAPSLGDDSRKNAISIPRAHRVYKRRVELYYGGAAAASASKSRRLAGGSRSTVNGNSFGTERRPGLVNPLRSRRNGSIMTTWRQPRLGSYNRASSRRRASGAARGVEERLRRYGGERATCYTLAFSDSSPPLRRSDGVNERKSRKFGVPSALLFGGNRLIAECFSSYSPKVFV